MSPNKSPLKMYPRLNESQVNFEARNDPILSKTSSITVHKINPATYQTSLGFNRQPETKLSYRNSPSKITAFGQEIERDHLTGCLLLSLNENEENQLEY